MHFSKLDTQMRVYEESQDYCVPSNVWIVARLDGKGFSKFTKRMNYTKPFDDEFKNIMTSVSKHLMQNTGFKFIYSYTESDEISLLFSFDENTFKRKLRKLTSTLAGYAASEFSLQTGERCSFDCRISILPSIELVSDYFSWRQEDANRNALNGYCYWTLRSHDITARTATSILDRMNNISKIELLSDYGIDYNDVPKWQKRGIGLYFITGSVYTHNPKTGRKVLVYRNLLEVKEDLSYQKDYRDFIKTQCKLNLASLKKEF